MIGDNKIKIPWYKRNVRVDVFQEDVSQSSTVRFPRTVPTPILQAEMVRQLEPQFSLEPEPTTIENPVPQPTPFPIPRKETEPFPFPLPRIGEQVPSLANPVLEPVHTDPKPLVGTIGHLLKPLFLLLIGKELINQYVDSNIADPIYNRMLEDPVLGLVLREAEKTNLDMEIISNYFANYDYDQIDIVQMTKELTALIGAAGAARIIVFFVGRKVLFRI